jgi:hypothetical protein
LNRLRAPPGAAERRVDARLEHEQRVRLRDVVVGAELEAEELVLLGRSRRQEDHGPLEAAIAQRLAHLVAVHPVRAVGSLVQHDVEDRDVGWETLDDLERGLAAASALHVKSFPLEEFHEGREDLFLVLDKKDSRHPWFSAELGGWAGKVSVNVLPFPSSERTAMSPPWARMMYRAIVRPMPVPFRFLAFES